MLSESCRTDKQGIKKGSQARPFSELVGTIGFEPTTPTMSRWCSNQLSYGRTIFLGLLNFGTTEWIRTSDFGMGIESG